MKKIIFINLFLLFQFSLFASKPSGKYSKEFWMQILSDRPELKEDTLVVNPVSGDSYEVEEGGEVAIRLDHVGRHFSGFIKEWINIPRQRLERGPGKSYYRYGPDKILGNSNWRKSIYFWNGNSWVFMRDYTHFSYHKYLHDTLELNINGDSWPVLSLDEYLNGMDSLLVGVSKSTPVKESIDGFHLRGKALPENYHEGLLFDLSKELVELNEIPNGDFLYSRSKQLLLDAQRRILTQKIKPNSILPDYDRYFGFTNNFSLPSVGAKGMFSQDSYKAMGDFTGKEYIAVVSERHTPNPYYIVSRDKYDYQVDFIEIDIQNVNDKPEIALNQDFSKYEIELEMKANETIEIPVYVNDDSPLDELSLQKIGLTFDGQPNASNEPTLVVKQGKLYLSYSPAMNQYGELIYRFKVSDPLESNELNVKIEVSNSNLIYPQIILTGENHSLNYSIRVKEDESKIFNFSVNSTLGSRNIISEHVSPTKGTLAINQNSFTFNPALNENGDDEFKLKAYDSVDNSIYQIYTFQVNLEPQNDPPGFIEDQYPASLNEDAESFSLNFKQQDAEDNYLYLFDQEGQYGNMIFRLLKGDGLTFGDSTGTYLLDENSGVLEYHPAKNYNGEHFVLVQVSDGSGVWDQTRINFTVAPQNDPPVLSPLIFTLEEELTLTAQINITDVDGDIGPFRVFVARHPRIGHVSVPQGTFGLEGFEFTYEQNVVETSSDSFDLMVFEMNEELPQEQGNYSVFTIKVLGANYYEEGERISLTNENFKPNSVSKVFNYKAYGGQENTLGSISLESINISKEEVLNLKAKDTVESTGESKLLGQTRVTVDRETKPAALEADDVISPPKILGIQRYEKNPQDFVVTWVSGGEGLGKYRVQIGQQNPDDNAWVDVDTATSYLIPVEDMNINQSFFVQEYGPLGLFSGVEFIGLSDEISNTRPVVKNFSRQIYADEILNINLNELITEYETPWELMQILTGPVSSTGSATGTITENYANGVFELIYTAPTNDELGNVEIDVTIPLSVIDKEPGTDTDGHVVNSSLVIKVLPTDLKSADDSEIYTLPSDVIEEGDKYRHNVKGEFSITRDGTVSFQLGFDFAPGRRELTPKIGLSYGYNSRNGIVGKDWGLSGLSVISRTAKNYYDDGKHGGIDFNLNDALSLDGNRLFRSTLESSDENVEAVFHPKHNPLIKVEAYGVVENSQKNFESYEYFVATDKDGYKKHYGLSSLTRESLESGAVIAYRLDKIVDPFGNAIHFIYEQASEERFSRLKRITYTDYYGENGQLDSSLSTGQSIEFVYEDRPDPLSNSILGYSSKITQRLSEIINHNGQWDNTNQVVLNNTADYEKKWTLSYVDRHAQELARESLIEMVGLEIKDRTNVVEKIENLLPIEFTYFRPKWNEHQVKPLLAHEVSDGSNFIPLDINNDGYADLWQEGFHVNDAVNINDRSFTHQATLWINPGPEGFRFESSQISGSEDQYTLFENTLKPIIVLPLDYNGDGWIDVARFVYPNLMIYTNNQKGGFELESTTSLERVWETPRGNGIYGLSEEIMADILYQSFGVDDADRNGKYEVVVTPMRGPYQQIRIHDGDFDESYLDKDYQSLPAGGQGALYAQTVAQLSDIDYGDDGVLKEDSHYHFLEFWHTDDFDNDGSLDRLYLDESGTHLRVVLYWGNGDPAIDYTTDILSGSVNDDTVFRYIDVDLDDKIDVFFYTEHRFFDILKVVENNGQWSFQHFEHEDDLSSLLVGSQQIKGFHDRNNYKKMAFSVVDMNGVTPDEYMYKLDFSQGLTVTRADSTHYQHSGHIRDHYVDSEFGRLKRIPWGLFENKWDTYILKEDVDGNGTNEEIILRDEREEQQNLQITIKENSILRYQKSFPGFKMAFVDDGAASFHTGDFNGDGKTDFCFIEKNAGWDAEANQTTRQVIKFILADGETRFGFLDGFALSDEETSTEIAEDTDEVNQVLDLNGDGRSEIVRLENMNDVDTKMVILNYSEVSGTFIKNEFILSGANPTERERWVAGDFFATGRPTFLGYSFTAGEYPPNQPRAEATPFFIEPPGIDEHETAKKIDALLAIQEHDPFSEENLIGNRYEIEYGPISEYHNFTKEATRTGAGLISSDHADNMNLLLPLQVVSKYRTRMGHQDFHEISLRYEDFTINRRGLGVLGFAKVIEEDERISGLNNELVRVESTYLTDPLSAGALSSTKRFINGKKLSETQNDYVYKNYPNILEIIQTPLLASEKRTVYDHNSQKLMLVKSTKHESYDKYFMSSSVTETTRAYYGSYEILNDSESNSGSAYVEYITKYTSETTHDEANWRLGVIESRSTSYQQGQYTSVQKNDFTYNSKGLLYEDTRHAKGKSSNSLEERNLYLRRKLLYDQFGNPKDEYFYHLNDSGEVLFKQISSTYDHVQYSPGHFRYQHIERQVKGFEAQDLTSPVRKVDLVKSFDEIHLLTGKATSVTEFNGVKSVSVYSPSGIVEQLIKTNPDGQSRVANYGRYFVPMDTTDTIFDIPHATYFDYFKEPGKTYTVKIFDAAEREIRRVTKVQNAKLDENSDQNEYDDGVESEIFIDNIYNERGELLKTSHPYYLGNTIPWTIHEYDSLGRPIKITSPKDYLGRDSVMTFEYRGFRVTSKENGAIFDDKVVNHAEKPVVQVDKDGSLLIFEYDGQHNLRKTIKRSWTKATVSSGGGQLQDDIVVSRDYDDYGRLTELNDPDTGIWAYAYDAFDNLIEQTNADGAQVQITYDALNRPMTRIETKSSQDIRYNFFRYDATSETGVHKGLPASEALYEGGLDSENLSFLREYDFNAWGERISVKTTVSLNMGAEGGAPDVRKESKEIKTVYDHHGRVLKTIYPGTIKDPEGLVVVNKYDKTGELYQVTDHTGQRAYWQAGSMAASGLRYQVRYGNGTKMQYAYDQVSGVVTSIKTDNQQGEILQSLRYQYDLDGNLTSRQDRRQNVREDFGYDSLDRLNTMKLYQEVEGSSAPKDRFEGGFLKEEHEVRYDYKGNITYKSGVGYYHYATSLRKGNQTRAGPHAVTRVSLDEAGQESLVDFTYDNVGNVVDGGGLKIVYNAFSKPIYVQKGNNDRAITSIFKYDTGKNRYLGSEVFGETRTDTLSILGLYEEVINQTTKIRTIKQFIKAGTETIAVKTFSNIAPEEEKTFYYHFDHLRSVVAMSDQDGIVSDAKRFSYDAFGASRNLDWTSEDKDNGLSEGEFTGHKKISQTQIVHMGGRIYAPILGRFLNGDTYIQNEMDLQNYNRYSYGLNNPLNGIDPTGNYWENQTYKKPRSLGFLRVILTIVAMATGQVWAAALIMGIGTAIITYIETGDFGKSIVAGVVAGVTTYLGQAGGNGFSKALGIAEKYYKVANVVYMTVAQAFSSDGFKGNLVKNLAANLILAYIGANVDLGGSTTSSLGSELLGEALIDGLVQGAIGDLIFNEGSFKNSFISGFFNSLGNQTYFKSPDGKHGPNGVGLIFSMIGSGFAAEGSGGDFFQAAVYNGIQNGAAFTFSNGQTNKIPESQQKNQSTAGDGSEKDGKQENTKNSSTFLSDFGDAISELVGGLSDKITESYRALVGDPVNALNGSFFVEEQPDITVKGRAFTLSINRVYNSRMQYESAFGYGWTTEHHHRLHFVEPDKISEAVNKMQENGQTVTRRFKSYLGKPGFGIDSLTQQVMDHIFYYDHRGQSHMLKPQENVEDNGDGAKKRVYEGEDEYRFKFYFLDYPGEANDRYVLERLDLLTLVFNAEGEILYKENARGERLIYQYNENTGLLEKIYEASLPNRYLMFHYTDTSSETPKVTQVSDHNNRFVTYTYDANGQDLTGFTDLEGFGPTYHYTSGYVNNHLNHNMDLYTDAEGHSLKIEYYSSDRVAFHQNDLGDVFSLYYDTDLGLSVALDENGNQTQFHYDQDANITREVDANGASVYTDFDTYRNKIRITDKKYYVSEYVYSDPAKGQLDYVIDAGGFKREYKYHETFNKITNERIYLTPVNKADLNFTDEDHPVGYHECFYKYDDVTAQLIATSKSWRTDTGLQYAKTVYEYDERFLKTAKIRLKASQSPRYVVHAPADIEWQTTYNYDEAGINVVKVTDFYGDSKRMQYDALDRLTHSYDEANTETRYEYNDRNLLTFKYEPTLTREYRYNANRQVTHDILHHGTTPGPAVTQSITRYEYYPSRDMVTGGQLQYKYDPLNHREEFKYDPVGNLIEKVDKESQRTQYEYDSLNRLRFTINHYGVEAKENSQDYRHHAVENVYDNNSNLIEVIDGKGHSIKMVYNSKNQKVEQTDQLGNTTRYHHDYAGRVRKMWAADGKLFTTTKYDHFGRRTATILEATNDYSHPAHDGDLYDHTREVYNTYDSVGRIIETKDALGNKVVLSYHPTERKTTRQYFMDKGDASLEPDLPAWVVANASNTANDATHYYYGQEVQTFDSRGNLIEVENRDGSKISYTYDILNRKISQTDESLIQTQWEYNATGQIAYTTDALGTTTSFTYNDRFEMLSSTQVSAELDDQSGEPVLSRAQSRTYTPNGLVKTMTDFEGRVTTQVYDELNRPVQVEVSDTPTKMVYSYDLNHNIVTESVVAVSAGSQMEDLVTKYNYNKRNERIATTMAYNELAQNASHQGYNITTQTEYDELGRVVTEIDPEGNRTETLFNPFGEVEAIKNARGDMSYQYFNGIGHTIKVVDFVGNETETTTDMFGRTIKVVQAPGAVDENSNSITSITYYEHNLKGLLEKEIRNDGEKDLVTTYEYYPNSWLKQTVLVGNLEDLVTSNTYNNAGQVLTVSVDGEIKSTNRYDAFARLVEQENALGGLTTTTYDIVDRIISRTLPETAQSGVLEQRELLYTYDKHGFLVKQSDGIVGDDPFNAYVTYRQFDELGRVTKVVNPKGQVFETEYTPLGWVKASIENKENLNTANITNDILVLTYTARAAGSEVKTQYYYDNNGQVLKQVNAIGGTHRFVYNELNLLSEDIDHDNTSEKLYYDGNGQLTKRIRRNGETVEQVYDELNRVTHIYVKQSENGNAVLAQQFEYDLTSKMTKAIDYNLVQGQRKTPQGVEVRYSYDEFGRKITESQGESASPYLVQYQYDSQSRLKQLTYPSNRQYQWSYNAADQLSNITQVGAVGGDKVLFNVNTFHATGEADNIEYGQNITLRRTVDYRGILMDKKFQHNSTVLYQQEVQALDALGQITSETIRRYNNSVTSTYAATHQYDNQNRLIADTLSGWGNAYDHSHNWNYDKVGNFTSTNHTGSDIETGDPANSNPAQRFHVNGDNEYNGFGDYIQRTEISLPSHEGLYAGPTPYDKNGNLEHLGNPSLEGDDPMRQKIFEYDWLNRMTKVTHFNVAEGEDPFVVEYTYDALSRRVLKTKGNGDVTSYIYNEGEVIEEYETPASGTDTYWARAYVYGQSIDELIAFEQTYQNNYSAIAPDTELYYYVTDRLGSVQMLLSETGIVADSFQYNAYGIQTNVFAAPGSNVDSLISNPYGFTGRRYDDETGLWYYRNRMYSAEIGRFLQRDPLGYVDGVNMYAYVTNNPIAFVDPMGTVKRGINAVGDFFGVNQEIEPSLTHQEYTEPKVHEKVVTRKHDKPTKINIERRRAEVPLVRQRRSGSVVPVSEPKSEPLPELVRERGRLSEPSFTSESETGMQYQMALLDMRFSGKNVQPVEFSSSNKTYQFKVGQQYTLNELAAIGFKYGENTNADILNDANVNAVLKIVSQNKGIGEGPVLRGYYDELGYSPSFCMSCHARTPEAQLRYSIATNTANSSFTIFGIRQALDFAVGYGTARIARSGKAFTNNAPSTGKPKLRQQYEAEVKDLENLGLNARAGGQSTLDTAKMLNHERNMLKVKYREMGPADKAKEFAQRNVEKYGNPIGPTVKQLQDKGKSLEQIIESAARPGGADLGF